MYIQLQRCLIKIGPPGPSQLQKLCIYPGFHLWSSLPPVNRHPCTESRGPLLWPCDGQHCGPCGSCHDTYQHWRILWCCLAQPSEGVSELCQLGLPHEENWSCKHFKLSLSPHLVFKRSPPPPPSFYLMVDAQLTSPQNIVISYPYASSPIVLSRVSMAHPSMLLALALLNLMLATATASL